MGITSVLPNTPAPSVLAVVALVALALALFGRIVARIRTEEACRPQYKLGLIIFTVVLAAGFSVAAYSKIIDAGMPMGNFVALVGGAIVGGFIFVTMIKLFRRPGRFLVSRLPLGLLALFALTMYVAIISYSQTVAANSGGSLGASVWWNVYRGALVVADLLTVTLVVYAAVLLVVGPIVWLINTIRRRRAAAAGTP